MSDLAPFVASILRDDCVYELEQENLRLKQALEAEEERQLVRLTIGNQVLASGHVQENGHGLLNTNGTLDGRYLVYLEPQEGIHSYEQLSEVHVSASGIPTSPLNLEEVDFLTYHADSQNLVLRFGTGVYATLGPCQPDDLVNPSPSPLQTMLESGATLVFHCCLFRYHPHLMQTLGKD